MENMDVNLPPEGEGKEQAAPASKFGALFLVTFMTLLMTTGIMALLYYVGPAISKKLLFNFQTWRFAIVGAAVLGGSAFVSSLLFWVTTQRVRAVDGIVFIPLGVLGLSALIGAFGYAGWLMLSVLIGEANIFISLGIGIAVVYILYTLMVE
ncbi:hypothetical protein KKF84_21985 [Myxococcota bacterium]|nr:hypothetical protein [Myxococcota bacterium]